MKGDLQGRRILVVEDQPLNLELALELLRNAGAEVTVAEKAEPGIELARRHPPDLILMDVQLPGMDGLAATRILKEDEATRSIPVVALSAHAMEGDRERALAAGAAGYITKPVDTKTFAREVAGYLEDQGGRR